MILDPNLYLLFLTAAFFLTISPGPDTMFVLGASFTGGTRGGLLASTGTLTGLFFHTGFAVVGVSALIAASPLAFDILRIAGALYLLWIGVPLLFKALRNETALPEIAQPNPKRLFWQGATTNILNPKVAVFYVAFLPQFVAPELGHATLQLLLLGLTHWLMGLLWLGGVAIASGKFADVLRRSPKVRRALDALSGLVFVGLALRLVLAERRT